MRTMIAIAGVCATLALASCSPTQLTSTQATISASMPVAQSLADLAAADNHTVATVLAGGAAICKKGAGYVALAQTIGGFTSYSSVVNALAQDVTDACAVAGGVPVALPAGTPAASVPVVVLPAASALKPAA